MQPRSSESLRTRFSQGLLAASVAQLLSLGAGLFLVWYVVSTAGREAWGLITVATSLAAILGTVDLAASSGLSQRLTKAMSGADPAEFSKWFTTGITLQLIAAAVVGAAFAAYGFSGHLAPSSAQSGLAGAPAVFALVVTSVIVTTLTLPYNACVLATNRVDIYSISVVLSTGIRLLTTVIAFRVFGASATAYAFALVIGAAGQAIIVRVWVARHVEGARFNRKLVNRETIRSLVSLNALVLFNTLNHTLFLQLPVIALHRGAGLAEVGTWGIGLQLANGLRTLATPGYNALWPAITTLYVHRPGRLKPVFQFATKTAVLFGMLTCATLYVVLIAVEFRPVAALPAHDVTAVITLVLAAALGISAMPAAAVLVASERLKLSAATGVALLCVMCASFFYLATHHVLSLIAVAVVHAVLFGFYQLVRIGLAARAVGARSSSTLFNCVVRPAFPAVVLVMGAVLARMWFGAHIPAALALVAALVLALSWTSVYDGHERFGALAHIVKSVRPLLPLRDRRSHGVT